LACPFCGAVGEPLAARRDRAVCVAIGEPTAAAYRDPEGLPMQPLAIVQRLGDGAADAAEPGAVVQARVPGPIAGTALLFAEQGADPPARPSGGGLRWSAIAADEALIGYLATAPGADHSATRRLRWFAARLEHPHPEIAQDAFAEFGLAAYADVRAVADAFDAGRLRLWITSAAIDQRRRGFYGLALGLVAATTDDPGEREACRKALADAIAAPADDFRAGFAGLLGGLLVADGPDGLAAFDRLGLLAAAGRPVDQRHVLEALRFAAENLRDTIPPQTVAAATARLVASPAVAAEATVDLARARHWDALDRVADLWDTLGRADPLVRRAVAGYLAACPLPAARQRLAEIRERDPVGLDRALEAAALPLAR